ncbi:MAG: ribosome recycling factor [Patescibacteria group bacterium]|nr:ribosome recycling factor [Patescibacteria group bacterium]
MYQSIINSTRPKMQEVIDQFQDSLKNLRTGRASAGLVESIKVNYYGTPTLLKQLASINIPAANSIVITPWDQNSLGDIELAVRNSDLGMSPANDGKSVRLSLPPMTEERRNELVKSLRKTEEEAKIVLRQVRQDAWEEIKKLEKDGKVTEDDRYRSEEELNKIINDFNKKIETLTIQKEKELQSI